MSDERTFEDRETAHDVLLPLLEKLKKTAATMENQLVFGGGEWGARAAAGTARACVDEATIILDELIVSSAEGSHDDGQAMSPVTKYLAERDVARDEAKASESEAIRLRGECDRLRASLRRLLATAEWGPTLRGILTEYDIDLRSLEGG